MSMYNLTTRVYSFERRHCSVFSDEGVQFTTAEVFNGGDVFIVGAGAPSPEISKIASLTARRLTLFLTSDQLGPKLIFSIFWVHGIAKAPGWELSRKSDFVNHSGFRDVP